MRRRTLSAVMYWALPSPARTRLHVRTGAYGWVLKFTQLRLLLST